PVARARRGDLDRPRPQVRGSEDRVPPRPAARRAFDPSKPAGRAEARLAAGERRDRQARRAPAAPGAMTSARKPDARPPSGPGAAPTDADGGAADPGAPLAARRPGPSTAAVHAGEPRRKPVNALATPIIQTATYTFADTQELRDHFE